MKVTLSRQAIAALTLTEVLNAAATDGVAFTDEQLAFIEQGLADAAQEGMNRIELARERELKALASAMQKLLPPLVFNDVVAHLDPLTPFLKVLRDV